MAGTKEGAAKTRAKNLKKNPNFYADIGKKAWDNPDRNRVVGFAADRTRASEAGKKGGSKTKSEYKKKEETVEEDLDTLINILKESDSGSL